MDLKKEERRRDMVEFEAANTIRKMLREIEEQKDLTDQEKIKEIEHVLKEAQKIRSESMKRMTGI